MCFSSLPCLFAAASSGKEDFSQHSQYIAYVSTSLGVLLDFNITTTINTEILLVVKQPGMTIQIKMYSSFCV